MAQLMQNEPKKRPIILQCIYWKQKRCQSVTLTFEMEAYAASLLIIHNFLFSFPITTYG